MGSSNFLPWDQGQVNSEDDAAYASDPQRINGGPDGAAFPSLTFNKFALQTSGIAYCIGQLLASKGYVVTDSNLPAITAALETLFANVPGRNQLQSVAYSPLITLNASQYLGFEIFLSGNTTISMSGQGQGDSITLIFIQNSAGGNGITWSGDFVGAMQPDPAPNAVSVQVFKVADDLRVCASTPNMSAVGINNTSIGKNAPASGAFTSISASVSSTAPTVAGADNSTNVATTAWVKLWNITGFAISLGANGYIKFPSFLGGLQFMWGSVNMASTNQPVSFIPNFPNSCFQVIASTLDSRGGGSGDRITYVLQGTVSRSGCTLSNNGSGSNASWFAIGN